MHLFEKTFILSYHERIYQDVLLSFKNNFLSEEEWTMQLICERS